MPDDDDATRTTQRRPRRERDDDTVLPQTSSDERAEGWGDDGPLRDAEWYRQQRPPHHE